MIPFNIPYTPEISKRYVLDSLASSHQQGDGPFTARASKIISNLVGGGHVLLTPSCTHALELASMLANFGPGDEVILPSYNFTSAATAVTKFGATPVFVDVDFDTKGINLSQVQDAITSKTKAISWVNYAGIAPDIEGLQSLSKEFNLLLIEDNAHGLGSSYKGKPLGSFGDFATQSFHATKNVQCGEGGALIVNNPQYIERAEIIREKGTDRSKFIRGEVQKYQWVDQGSSYLLAETLAAQLLGQLEEFTQIHNRRERIFQRYYDSLSEWSESAHFDIHFVRNLDLHRAHMFYLVAGNRNSRDGLIDRLDQLGIKSTFHYQSLASSIKGKFYYTKKEMPHESERLSHHLLRLPLYYSLSEKEQDLVIEAVLGYEHKT